MFAVVCCRSFLSFHNHGPVLPDPVVRRRQKTEAGAAEACHFCNERVYLVERMSAEGRFFHHGCFRCEYCGTVLKMS